jgi:hypothetical protein
VTPPLNLLCEVIWSVLCVAVGFGWGRYNRRAIETIAVAAVARGGSVAVEETSARRRLRFEHVIAAFLVLLGLFTAAQSWYQSERTRQNAECTRAYADGFADALDARSEASAAAQNALDAWMTTLDELMTKTPPGADPTASRERFRAATVEYLSKRAEAKKQMRDNPFPAAPRDLCR